jgi:type I restriction enzyme S subunit
MTLQLEMQDINLSDPTKVPEGYKWTEAGVIPDDWEVQKLGELATFRTGPFGSMLHKSDYIDDGIPLINPMHIVNGKLTPSSSMSVSEQAAKKLAIFRLKVDDIVIGRRGDMGRCAVAYKNQEGWLCGTGSLIIRCNTKLFPQFVQLLLASPKVIAAIEDASVGSTMINLNQATLASLLIQRPSLTEQRAIATALSDVDALIEALEKLIAKKRDIKLATMQQLLTGKTRLPGFSGEWDSMPLANVADKRIPFSFIGGPFGSNLKASEYTSSGVRIIQLQNIGDGVFYDDYAIYTSEKKADELYACNIYPGEIIIAKMGDPVARACIVPKQNKRYLMASDGIRLAVDKRDFSTRFVHDYINFSEFRNKAIEASTGSTRMRISLNKLKQLPFKAPKLKEQQAIATVFSDMDAEIEALERRLEKTKQIKQGMMQQLLTGRVRLV